MKKQMAASARETRSNPVPKFEVGEKVLCYEPDTNKARVLYESKVLEVDITKDEKGRKIPEYFIHFSGWNKSWDRWVMEDQVLKDCENNRLLMSKLHENALKSVKKKRRLTQDSQSSCKEGEGVIKTEGKASDVMVKNIFFEEIRDGVLCKVAESFEAEINKTNKGEEAKTVKKLVLNSLENQDLPKIELEIPSQLKLKLEDDCYFIKRKKKLVQLPRTPNVAQVLNDYYQHYESFYPGQCCNLVKEVMDGLRIYFDFTLPTLLLYNFEREQYQTVMKLTPDEENSKERHQEELNGRVPADDKYGVVSSSSEAAAANKEPVESTSQVENQGEGKQERLLRRRTLRNQPSVAEASQSATVSSTSSSPPESHTVSGVKRKTTETEDTQSNGTEPCFSVPPPVFPTSPIPSSLRVSIYTMPSQIYGPEHLLRLFVKLPGLLARTEMPEKNLSVLLKHINTFLKYLAERSSVLFPEDMYYNSLL